MKSDTTEQTAGGLLGPSSRRRLIERAGYGAAAFGALTATAGRFSPAAAQTANIDIGILNFALNLEYLEGEFYSLGVSGQRLSNIGTPGSVKGGSQVPWALPRVGQLINEIATDEANHVQFLRANLLTAAVPEPDIDFTDTFAALGQAIGLPGFNPFNDQLSFLLGAYIFEDVGVTAYHGAAPLVTDKTYLSAAAGILAVEAYHASSIRTLLLEAGGGVYTDRISAIRAAASGTGPGTNLPADDEGTIVNRQVNIVPTDTNSIAFARTPQQVLAIVFNGGATSGGFFPNGVSGMFTSSVS